jgi:hypothetical protein
MRNFPTTKGTKYLRWIYHQNIIFGYSTVVKKTKGYISTKKSNN